MIRTKSKEFYNRAINVIPGGVTSSARRLDPVIIWEKGEGAYLWDLDGNKYIDYHGAWAPIILGYQNKYVVSKVIEAVKKYDLYGTGVTEPELRLSEKLVEHIPSAEKVLLTTSGSAATYNAIRAARAITGREKIIKFEGNYHGWHDYVLMNYSSKEGTTYVQNPESSGMLRETVNKTLICRINDLDNVKKTINKNKGDIAAIILEPIAHNMGCVVFTDDFLKQLRKICNDEKIILIFDEVITGFRVGLGGYQKICGVTPDITTLGKAIANGYPVAAVAGRKDIMDRFATNKGGDIAFGGTFNGHPIPAAAGVATIEILEKNGVYKHIFSMGERIRKGLKQIIDSLNVEAKVAGYGSVFVIYWGTREVTCYEDLFKADSKKSLDFRKNMIDEGHYFLPLSNKRALVTYSHTTEDIDRTLTAAEKVIKKMKIRF